jgi:AcrR family transcriptional regulator
VVHEVIDLQQARHSPRVARKRQARIREIVCAALAMLRDEGNDALTLGRVATRLGLTTAALYRYFPSKDALDAELQRAVIAALVASVRERTEAADAYAVREALCERDRALLAIVVTALVFERFAETSPAEFGCLTRNLSTPDHVLPDREAAHVFEAAWSALVDLAVRIEVAQGCDVLSQGDPNERAVALWAALQGVVQTRKLVRSARGRIEPGRVAQSLVRSLLVGWGAAHDAAQDVLDLAEREGFADELASTLDFLHTN